MSTWAAPVVRTSAVGALAALAWAALAACGGGAGDEPTALPGAGAPEGMVAVEAPECLPAGTLAFRAGPDDAPTLVAVVGEGETGVVLAPQNGGDWCQWAGEVDRLVEAGHAVATFTWASDSAASLRFAVDAITDAGAGSFALVGASKGGTFAAALAAELRPAAVIALSPPAEFDGADGRAANSGYTGPLLVVASADDGGTPAADSREVARDDESYLEVPGSAHGVRIFDGESADEVRAAIDATLAEGFGAD